MDRGSFLKNSILSAFGVVAAKQIVAQNPQQLEAAANTEAIREKWELLKAIRQDFELHKKKKRVSYSTWVYSDFTKFDTYLANKDYVNLEEEYNKLYASVRWYLNRLKHEDIKNWEDNLTDADMFNSSEAVSVISTITNKISKCFPLIDCKDKYYADWSRFAYYNNLTALGEVNLLISNNENAYKIFDSIKESYIAYKHKEFKSTRAPFGWIATILDENELHEKAYEFAKLDQETRTDGTNSRLFKQLSKKLKYV
jgi:hypothetical protein